MENQAEVYIKSGLNFAGFIKKHFCGLYGTESAHCNNKKHGERNREKTALQHFKKACYAPCQKNVTLPEGRCKTLFGCQIILSRLLCPGLSLIAFDIFDIAA